VHGSWERRLPAGTGEEPFVLDAARMAALTGSSRLAEETALHLNPGATSFQSENSMLKRHRSGLRTQC
jgi:hypothetical protein